MSPGHGRRSGSRRSGNLQSGFGQNAASCSATSSSHWQARTDGLHSSAFCRIGCVSHAAIGTVVGVDYRIRTGLRRSHIGVSGGAITSHKLKRKAMQEQPTTNTD